MGRLHCMSLNNEDRETLRRLARRSIALGFDRRSPAALEIVDLPPQLLEPRASFVTLTQHGRLRGCRGTLEALRPMAQDVWENAWASAFDDPRFAPLPAAELADLELEISLLSPTEPMNVVDEADLLRQLRPGIDGLVLAHGARRATFLPEVWKALPEPRQFVAELKRKAGWPQDFWSPALRCERYTAECF